MGKKILVAESDSTVQQVVSYFLNLEGFEVTTAGDGVDALDKIEVFQPEVILLDPGLAGINGIEVSWLVREKSQFKNVPILYIVDSKESLEKIGKDIPPGYGIINKPVDPTKMVNTIKEFAEKAKQPVVARNITEEQEEPISIEELLGWERAPVMEEGKKGGGQKSEEVGDRPAALSALHEELSELFLKQELTEDTKGGKDSKAVEADLRGRVTDDMIKDIVSKIARDIIERKVLEIVPKIAEEEVKKEIERLKGETPDKSGNYM